MSEAPTPSPSSTTLAVVPLDGNKTSKILAENKSSAPTDSNSPQESPSGESPPSPNSSSGNETPPPPPDNSSPSSPPAKDSNTPSSDSPPPDSNSSPPSPSDSGSSPSPPPPPSDNSNSDSSPPPPDSDSSNSSPPSDSQSSPPPPPPPSDSNSPPPKGDTPSPPAPPPDSTVAKPPSKDHSSSPSPEKSSSPPKSPPKESSPPPTESKASPPAPTQPLAPLPKTPVTPNSPPQSHDSPPAPTYDSRSPTSVPTPPGSKASQHVPGLTPPSTRSGSSTPPPSSSDSSTVGVAGATLAGLVIIAFVAIFFVVARKKKKRANAYPGYFGPPPNYSGSADGYYYAQHSQQHSLPNSRQHAIGIAGQSNEFYSGPSTMGNGHGSYRAPESGVIAGGLSCFSYEELMGITSGFARQNVIGEGGFGSVYKGFLADGRAVAVKELKAGSGQGEREFRAEVEIISRVHHRHLVSLVGYCIADSHRLLVYEFVSNNTLEHHLHGEGVTVMEWSKRMKIAVGSARGLAYLHEDCHPKIIHRDIKSANILIDDDYEAQVADFGLAKLSDDISAHVSTRVMGTFGYLAPEYAASGKLSDKSDVFSFGVVLLEIVTGRKPVDGSQPLGDESLVEWARPLLAHALETGDFSELVDPRLGNRYVEDEMLRMISAASASVRHSAPKRPRMVQVLRALDTEGDMPDLTNGVKVGQSTIFQAGQNVSDMQKFRMMAFGSEDSSEYQMQSGNFTSGEAPRRPRPGDTGAVEFSSGELETRAINPRSNRQL